MKKGLFLVLGLSVLLTTAHAAQADGCNRYYQSAVKFIVDTPTVHSFTVSAGGRKVLFSTGNLQYCPARDEWRFALRQFDRVGHGKSVYAPEGLKTAGTNVNDNVTTVFYDSIDYSTKDNSTASGFKEVKGVPCNNLFVSKKYGGWIDVFAWGTSGHGRRAKDSLAMFFAPYNLNGEKINNANNVYAFGPSFDAGHGPGATSNDIDFKSGTNRFFDWGYHNVIREYHNSVYDANQALVVQTPDSTMYRRAVWRTLTADEWTYLLTKRIVDGNDSAFSYVRLQYGKNTTDTVSGVLIYPDDFSFSEAGVASLPFGATYGVSTIDASVWNALEEAGVVFLPIEQQRYISNGAPSITYPNDYGMNCAYWSASAYDAEKAHDVWFKFRDRGLATKNSDPRYIAFPVRLVQDMMVRRYYATITTECEYEWDLGVKKIPITQNNAGRKIYNDTLRAVNGEDSLYCILTLTKEVRTTEIIDTTYTVSDTYTFTYGNYTRTWNLKDTGHVANTTKVYEFYRKDGDCDTALLRLKLTRKVAEFSVADNKKVTFSPGNVQYNPTVGWRFAPNQYDMCGNNNIGSISTTTNRWIDLFAWGSGSDPLSRSNLATFVDWGTNVINGYPKNTWYTLSRAEWRYVIENGTIRSSMIRFSLVRVKNVLGVMIYPDNFTWESAGVSAISNNRARESDITTLDDATWAKFEHAGCVFMPTAGRLRDNTIINYNTYVYIWFTDNQNTTYARCVYFYANGLSWDSNETKSTGLSVRLVRNL